MVWPDESWFLSTTSYPKRSTATVGTYIDPKTLKPCKHKWAPEITEATNGWMVTPECRKCGITGSPSDKGVSLAKLVEQMGR